MRSLNLSGQEVSIWGLLKQLCALGSTGGGCRLRIWGILMFI